MHGVIAGGCWSGWLCQQASVHIGVAKVRSGNDSLFEIRLNPTSSLTLQPVFLGGSLIDTSLSQAVSLSNFQCTFGL